jgi:hypothetical protein
MPTQVLSIGPVQTMLANQIYALPAVAVTLFTDAAATITQSNTPTFIASAAVTLTGGAAKVSGGFVRATADTLVTLKRD